MTTALMKTCLNANLNLMHIFSVMFLRLEIQCVCMYMSVFWVGGGGNDMGGSTIFIDSRLYEPLMKESWA